MDSERRLCETLEREADQLSPGFLSNPRLRTRLYDNLLNLAFCMEGTRAVISAANDSNQEKKDYTVDEEIDVVADGVNQVPNPTPATAASGSASLMADDSGAEYKSWTDEDGIEHHQVWEVDVLVYNHPLRSM